MSPAIVQIGNPALRKVSKAVALKDIGTPEIKKLLKEMSVALGSRDDGVGLSAPQIAVNKRVFVVAGKVFSAKGGPASGWDKIPKKDLLPDEFFLNPVIVKKSKKLATAEEGCLSIPNIYGMVKRPANVTIEYMNELGEKKTRGAGGLLARIFQHEIDHLDGTLFIDKATKLKELKNDNTNQEL